MNSLLFISIEQELCLQIYCGEIIEEFKVLVIGNGQSTL